jgi:hypothetical protein
MGEFVRQIPSEPIWSAFVIVVLLLLAAPFIAVPVGLIRLVGGFLLRRRAYWRAMPLDKRNHVRAGLGAAGLALCAAFGSRLLRLPHGAAILAGAAALSLLYLVAGALGTRGARFDFFSAFWFAVAALGCAAFLIFR